jgi:hypothetical protein
MRHSVDIGTTMAHESGTLLVRVRLYGFMPLEGARCFVPGAPYVAYSDGTGLCRLNVVAGKHVVGASFGGTHTAYSDTMEVEPGMINDDALIALYASDVPAPRTTASIRYFGRSEFEGVGEVGVVMLHIVTGGEMPCGDEVVSWDDETGVQQVKMTLIGMDAAFQGIGDLEVGFHEGLPAIRGEDQFTDLGHYADLRIKSIAGTEVSGHYEIKASDDQVVQEKLPFRAVVCPD